ncbi:hypothetical protein D3873_02195 [Paenisporosarcina cavernae]|uniref:Uncharacterized protein n=1 Tax=Paenisporosarcina cavernae TaxID=2320858 RepID=A0A385YST1_9BACL|nr:hypothetical protein D3873_02195 [Paenisporosarcina cavernae]
MKLKKYSVYIKYEDDRVQEFDTDIDVRTLKVLPLSSPRLIIMEDLNFIDVGRIKEFKLTENELVTTYKSPSI